MSEHPQHIPKHTGSGTAKCSCGWTSEHFAHDDDLWASFDAHVRQATADERSADADQG